MTEFQINDPSLESQWRALILFGKNSATYKFAFAKSLLELVNKETTKISLTDLSQPFSKNIIEHLKENDKQGNSKSSSFLNTCRSHIKGEISDNELWHKTEKLGFVNVVDAFQNINGGQITDVFYEKNYTSGKKEIIIKDSLLKLKESFHFENFNQEVEARWNLVETAWNLNLNPKLLEVKYDDDASLFFLENNFLRRTNITSVRDSLNGYQKGKCFYSCQDISVVSGSPKLCEVDHFLPHVNKTLHNEHGANINGVWNLVLADKDVNRNKSARIPEKRFLQKLFNRNEFYIQSKHPLAETIINQTGKTKQNRIAFLNKQYQISLNSTIITWSPEFELNGNI
ncbi:HNH endonuclease family protein [Flavicella sediminum]|uniref:HNH endonuclease domain-containing protein n=1 Tax=Flavicella sediminum TaxID=2585141 RepID=UPI001123B56F|nr:HNH endonuclease domain-containing protein [Flavicella sediminum]